jgi:hypothetical protein
MRLAISSALSVIGSHVGRPDPAAAAFGATWQGGRWQRRRLGNLSGKRIIVTGRPTASGSATGPGVPGP